MSTTKHLYEGAHNDNDFPSASPTTDGNYLDYWCGSADRFCHGLEGTKIWDRALGKARIESSLGEGCSPVLHDGNLITVRAQTARNTMAQNCEEGTTWATPHMIEHSGKTRIITAASGSLRSYDLETGDIIQRCNGLTKIVIPCPVVDGNRVIRMSGDKLDTPIATRNVPCVPRTWCPCPRLPHTGRQNRKHIADSNRVTKSR
ncbi:MAG: hypothetical protein ACPGLY_17590 [Rubripirellula sp.]